MNGHDVSVERRHWREVTSCYILVPMNLSPEDMMALNRKCVSLFRDSKSSCAKDVSPGRKTCAAQDEFSVKLDGKTLGKLWKTCRWAKSPKISRAEDMHIRITFDLLLGSKNQRKIFCELSRSHITPNRSSGRNPPQNVRN